jgi:hypothetical protein
MHKGSHADNQTRGNRASEQTDAERYSYIINGKTSHTPNQRLRYRQVDTDNEIYKKTNKEPRSETESEASRQTSEDKDTETNQRKPRDVQRQSRDIVQDFRHNRETNLHTCNAHMHASVIPSTCRTTIATVVTILANSSNGGPDGVFDVRPLKAHSFSTARSGAEVACRTLGFTKFEACTSSIVSDTSRAWLHQAS